MRKLITVTALLLMMTTAAAQADMSVYIAQGTISRAQADAIESHLEETLDESVSLILEEETGEEISQRIFSGSVPRLAVLQAEQAMVWAREGLLLELDGCVSEIGRMAQPLVDACVHDECLMLAPLTARRHMMAVRPEKLNAVNMGYLLDSRAHPVWYPSEFVQALDEMAILDEPGMDVWPPQENDLFWLEALLQGVCGLRLADEETGAYASDAQALEEALEWMGDMVRAELITTAATREEALERFLDGETAIFADWTAAESEKYAEEIKREEILLRPHPTLSGTQQHACELMVVCAFRSEEEQENAQARRAAAAMLGMDTAQGTLWRRSLYDDGTQYLPPLGVQEYGATLRALLCDAARGVIAGEADAEQAAQRIDRTMRTLGW